MIGGDSLLERVTAAAEERHLSHNSLLAYRRTRLKIIAWAAAEGLALETLPPERVVDFYEEATRGRSASHHLQVKAALALLYHVLGSPNPFAQCHGPKFAPEKTELRYHTSSQLGQLLRELREDKGSYFGHLCYHLASALFFTGCRYHEWALLTMDRLVREPGGVIIATRLQIKGGSFRDLPLTRELADSLEEWFAFLESVKGVRLRTGGIDFAGSPLVFPGRDGAPFGPPVAMERKLALSDLQLFVSFLGLSVQVTLTMMPPVLSVDGNERGTGAQAPTHTRVGEGGMHTGQLAADAQQQHSEEASSNEAMRRDLQCGTCCSCFR